MANPKFLSMRNELADNRFLGSYSRSVEEIIFLMGVVILSPIWVVMLHAVFGRYRLSRLGVFFLAISFSLFFLNRSFGIPLGGGAFDDVPQYVYLFLNIERYGLVEGNGIWTFEPGFIALTWLLALISDSSLFYLFMVFFISTFALINGINRLANFRVSVAIVAFFVIFGVVFYGYMHLLRQTLALSFLVWGCSYYIEESKGAITKGWVLFLLSGLLHVAAIPVFIGVVLTRRFWTRSKILLSLGLIIALPLAVFASDTFIMMAAGYTSRIQVYTGDQAGDYQLGQMLFSGISALILFVAALKSDQYEGKAAFYYALAIISTVTLCVASAGAIPSAIVSRQLMFVLGLLSIAVIVSALEEYSSRIVQVLFSLLLCSRLIMQLSGDIAHLTPFKESGALNLLGGLAYNMIEVVDRGSSEIPSWFGWGGV